MCLSPDWTGIHILSNSFVHCFVWCVWVRTSRPCISCLPWMSLFWLAVACALLVWFSSLALRGSSLSLLLLGGFGVVVLSLFVCPGGLGARGWPALSWFPPFPPPLVVFWCFLVQSVLLVPPSGYLVVFATVRLSYLRRPCGVVGRATFLTSRTDYRWRFDSPLVRRYASKCGDQAKANWRRPQKKGPVVIPLAWRVVADWLLSSLRFMATKASALCGALPSPPCCGCCTCAPRCGTEVFALG